MNAGLTQPSFVMYLWKQGRNYSTSRTFITYLLIYANSIVLIALQVDLLKIKWRKPTSLTAHWWDGDSSKMRRKGCKSDGRAVIAYRKFWLTGISEPSLRCLTAGTVRSYHACTTNVPTLLFYPCLPPSTWTSHFLVSVSGLLIYDKKTTLYSSYKWD